VNELNEILRPSWGSEQWILEGWQQISPEEKEVIKKRVDELFKDGLPFELKHNKLLYIYAFSILTQLEVLAIQIPLKFASQLSNPEHRRLMRAQLLDEIFHAIVFTKIIYLLCAPHALPPEYSENIEILCNFVRNEECPKVAILLLNLIGEGWIEEMFNSYQRQNIAPKVFGPIINDERRHVREADLYCDIGFPDKEIVQRKLEFVEEQMLTNVLAQYKYTVSVCTILGVEGSIGFLHSLDKKHTEQLSKLGLEPSQKWQVFMHIAEQIYPRILYYSQLNYEVEMTPIRKMLMTQWDNPSDPTMVGEFNINVSCLDFFNKKFPQETLTLLMMQAISLGLSEHEAFRSFLSQNKLYQSKKAYVGLIVKLPDCGDQIATVVFENCHEANMQSLAIKIKNIRSLMVYCFKKREQLEKEHPQLTTIMNKTLYAFANDLYPYPIPGNSVVSLSNIGNCGYTQTKSPLRANEVMKVTLLAVERRPVWNHETQALEMQDILPVSVSADHRIFDGNIPVPKLVDHYFKKTFSKMLNSLTEPIKASPQDLDAKFARLIENLLANNLEIGYKVLTLLQTYWLDFLSIEELLDNEALNKIMKENLDSLPIELLLENKRVKQIIAESFKSPA
jgi:2-oxoacid dehydrogenases acyltransferase (catalytic domain)